MDFIKQIILNFRGLILTVVFALYAFRFYKRDVSFRLITFYLFISFYKLLPTMYIDAFLDWYLLIQIIVLTAFYYDNFIHKGQRIATFILLLIVLCSTIFLKIKATDLINLFSITYTYVVVFFFTIIYFYNQMDSFDKYKYFNFGLFLFIFLTIVSIMIIEVIFLFTNKKYIDEENFTNISILFDILLLAFMIKQWLVLEKTK